jgi:hypothetical protein
MLFAVLLWRAEAPASHYLERHCSQFKKARAPWGQGALSNLKTTKEN